MAQSAKEQLIEDLRTLPDDISIEEIMYHLYIKETILQRMKECDQNPSVLISEKEVEEEIQKWFH